MSTASVSSTSRAPTGSNCGGDSTTASITGSQISIITDPYSNPRVHFSDSIDRSFDDEEEELRFSPGPIGSSGYSDKPTSHRSSSSPRSAACPTTVEYTPQETINYSGKYLSPLENNRANLSRSSPNSPAGSNISIIGSLISPCRKMGVSSGGNAPWKLRARFSKRRGKDRSTDRERDRDHDRQPSVCSDSETDSLTGVNSYRDELGGPNNKKWSLPLPVVTRSSESDSASSSWSARSADEATEDERSPVPSPSASTHSGDYGYGVGASGGASGSSNQIATAEYTANVCKTAELEDNKKLAMKAKHSEDIEYSARLAHEMSGAASSDRLGASAQSASKDDESDKAKRKKMSKAAETHRFQRMKTTNVGKCKMCDTFVYFWGLQCKKCNLICHKKCAKKMPIMCPRAPMPPRCGIVNLEIDLLSESELVPAIVLRITQEIERRALYRVGLYRMSGSSLRVEKLLKSFESGPHLIDLSEVSINDLTSVLKVFLREMKTPLIHNDVYKELIDIGRIYRQENNLQNDGIVTGEGPSEVIILLRMAISKLSLHRLATLRHVMAHLHQVADQEEQNSMTPMALGIVFAPTLFRPRNVVNDLYTEVFEAGPQGRVIELLIKYYHQIFDDRPEDAWLYCPDSFGKPTPVEDADTSPSSPRATSNNGQFSSESDLFKSTNGTGSGCGPNHPKCSTRGCLRQHMQIRRTSSTSSASPSPGAGSGVCSAGTAGLKNGHLPGPGGSKEGGVSLSKSSFNFE